MGSSSRADTLREAIAALHSDGRRGPQVRVERRDGSVVEGELAGAASEQLTVFVDATQRLTVLPFNTVQTFAVAEVVPRRYGAYLLVAGLTGTFVFASARQWAPDAFWTTVALGASAALAALLAGWVIRPLHQRLVFWRPIFRATDV